MKLLVTGGSGLIGSYLLSEKNTFRNFDVLSPRHTELDITNVEHVQHFFEKHQPDVVLNLAAHRNANTAEEQRNNQQGSAWQSNVVGTHNLAQSCSITGSYLIHLSTDYVFAGTQARPGPYEESDLPEENDALLSWYGVTKRNAEREIASFNIPAAIVRINNVTRPNHIAVLDYLGKIAHLYTQKKLYPMFDDQYITLTSLEHLKLVIQVLLDRKASGIYHVASSDFCTPHQVSNYLIEKMYNHKKAVVGHSMRPYLEKHPNRYPQWGGLKSEQTEQNLGISSPTWKKIVRGFIPKKR